jgi:uncharacterized protein (DUF302 family)
MRLFLTCARICLIVLSLILSACASNKPSQPSKSQSSWTYSIEGDFDEVKDDLIMAIESQGAVVSYIAHSSDMLNRTAITLEIEEKVYHKAEIILFCKAEISHKMVQADPHSLVLCPYPIAIYSLTESPNLIHLTIRKPPSGLPEYLAVQQFLVKVISETLEF